MPCGSCFLIPRSGLVPVVVSFKTAKAIHFVNVLIVALNNRGKWLPASSTFSYPPSDTFNDKGCTWWRVTRFCTFPDHHSCVTNGFSCTAGRGLAENVGPDFGLLMPGSSGRDY